MATIGIKKKIPYGLYEMALKESLNGDLSRSYVLELVAMEYTGKVSHEKAAAVISNLTLRNPLYDFLKENKDEVLESIRYKADSAVILTALLSATYEFVYDMMCHFGKFFHVQSQVTTGLILGKLSDKYGHNWSLTKGMSAATAMLVEAGLLKRPVAGIFELPVLTPSTEIARRIYDKAFQHWNSDITDIESCSSHPFFEFIN